MKIGILAIQGDYEAHSKVLERLGAEHTLVTTPEHLEGVRGLILPGGESTTHLKVLSEEGLLDAIRKFAADGGAFFGTCAGAILLAREVHGPSQPSLGLLDMVIQRNGYGRQLASDGGPRDAAPVQERQVGADRQVIDRRGRRRLAAGRPTPQKPPELDQVGPIAAQRLRRGVHHQLEMPQELPDRSFHAPILTETPRPGGEP